MEDLITLRKTKHKTRLTKQFELEMNRSEKKMTPAFYYHLRHRDNSSPFSLLSLAYILP